MNTSNSFLNFNTKRFFSGIDFFVISGRINRIRYLALYALWIIIILIAAVMNRKFQNSLIVITTSILLMVGFINLLFLNIRRLADFNRSGWWLLTGLIPIVNLLFHLLIFANPGTDGTNKYGEQPSRSDQPHIFMTFLLPIAILFFLAANYFGLSAHFEKWNKLNISNQYTIEVPYVYNAQNKTFSGIPYTYIQSEDNTKDSLFKAYIFNNINSSNPSDIESLHTILGLKNSLSDILDQSAELYMQNPLISTNRFENLHIIKDQLISQPQLKGRMVWADCTIDGKPLYIKSVTYVNEKDGKYYLLAGYYTDNYQFDLDTHVVDYFLNSLKNR